MPLCRHMYACRHVAGRRRRGGGGGLTLPVVFFKSLRKQVHDDWPSTCCIYNPSTYKIKRSTYPYRCLFVTSHYFQVLFFLASSQITGNRTYLRDHIILCLSHWSIYVSLINDTFRFNIKGRISNTNFAG